MRFLQLLILLPFLAFSHGDDLYLLKGAKVFLGNDGFVVKDILVDDGKIILVEDFIENIETGTRGSGKFDSVKESDWVDHKDKRITERHVS